MARREPLSVWLYGTRVAELTSTRPGEVSCRYTATALERWPSTAPVLSCSLPLGPRRVRADLFFRGLLPEGRHRQAMASEAGLPTYDTFGLLERYGRDIAGAAVITRDEPADRPGAVAPYTRESLEEEILALPDRPLGLHDDSELSIAGLQDKLLLVQLDDGTWGRPIHGRPSTHILKVEDRRYVGMATMEAACLRLAEEIGLTTVEVTVDVIADLPCLIVSRFDRVPERDGGVCRVHQEDACQASGRDADADRGKGKYERSGGPGFREIAVLLDRYAADPLSELTRLVQTMTFTVAIGNADAHGKNIGLLHPNAETVTLAPLYDTVPTVMWPNLRRGAAMRIAGRDAMGRITLDDVVAEAARWRLNPERSREAAVDILERIVEAVPRVEMPDPLATAITERARRLLED